MTPLPHHTARSSPLAMRASRSRSRLVALIGALLALAALACSTGSGPPRSADDTLRAINNGEIFDDLLDQKQAPPQGDEAAREGRGAGAAQHGDFFDVPPGWEVSAVDEESHVYRLRHPSTEGASLVISHEALEATGDEARKQALGELHQEVITRLPERFTLELDEYTTPRGQLRYHTRLRGRAKPESAELLVSGFSVAIGQDAYLIFCAYPSQASGLSADVVALVDSLRAYPVASVSR